MGKQKNCEIDEQPSHTLRTFRLARFEGQFQSVRNGQHECHSDSL